MSDVETEIKEMLRRQAASVEATPMIPPATVRRAQQRRVFNSVTALATVAAVIVGAVVGVASLRDGAREIPFVDQPIKPKAMTRIDVGGSPAEVVSGFGSLWVERQDEVVRVDPRTNKVVARIEPAGEPQPIDGGSQRDRFYLGARGLAAGEGAVWVVATGGFTEFAVQAQPIGGSATSSSAQSSPEPVTATLRASAQPIGPGSSPSSGDVRPPPPTTAPTPGGPSRWSLLRIDPRTDEWSKIADVDGYSPAGMAAGEGAVWVAGESFPTGGALYRIDPRSGKTTTIELGGSPSAVVVSDGFVWVAVGGNGPDANSILKVDPRSGRVAERVVKRIPIPDTIVLQHLAAADGSIWVTALLSEGRSAVARVDARSGTLSAIIPAEGVVEYIAVGPTGVWVSTQDDNWVRRLDPALNEFTGRLTIEGLARGLVAEQSHLWVLSGPLDRSTGSGIELHSEGLLVRFDL